MTDIDERIDERMKRQIMQEMGRRGGLAKTNHKRGFAALSPERRRELGAAGGRAKKKLVPPIDKA